MSASSSLDPFFQVSRGMTCKPCTPLRFLSMLCLTLMLSILLARTCKAMLGNVCGGSLAMLAAFVEVRAHMAGFI